MFINNNVVPPALEITAELDPRSESDMLWKGDGRVYSNGNGVFPSVDDFRLISYDSPPEGAVSFEYHAAILKDSIGSYRIFSFSIWANAEDKLNTFSFYLGEQLLAFGEFDNS